VKRTYRGPTGVGLGLRWEFLEEVLAGPPLDVSFFEVSPENYMRRGGYYPAALEQVRERYALITHGLTLSLGAVDPPEPAYLAELKREVTRLRSPWHSDHVCFSTAGSRVLHDLLPLKLCEENAQRVADRVRDVEDALGVPMAVENISWYAHPGRPELPEAEFIGRILERSDAGLLLDVNNVYVNAQNHGFDPYDFLRQMPFERVVQIHVAGHTRLDSGLVLDTHGAPVCDPVYELLDWTIERTGPVPVLLERDNDIPELDELLTEVRAIERVYQRALARREERLARSA
jgi:uncharacterized protein